MEYLNNVLWGSLSEEHSTNGPECKQVSPRIAPITEVWQTENVHY